MLGQTLQKQNYQYDPRMEETPGIAMKDEPSKKGCGEHPWFQRIQLINISTSFVGIQYKWEENIIVRVKVFK
jgi:hypothetical protein